MLILVTREGLYCLPEGINPFLRHLCLVKFNQGLGALRDKYVPGDYQLDFRPLR